MCPLGGRNDLSLPGRLTAGHRCCATFGLPPQRLECPSRPLSLYHKNGRLSLPICRQEPWAAPEHHPYDGISREGEAADTTSQRLARRVRRLEADMPTCRHRLNGLFTEDTRHRKT